MEVAAEAASIRKLPRILSSIEHGGHGRIKGRLGCLEKHNILGAQVFPNLVCPWSLDMTVKKLSVFIKIYMSNLKSVLFHPWNERTVYHTLSLKSLKNEFTCLNSTLQVY
jgi:hypothetical protein